MGCIRFVLAALVVLFHLGGAGLMTGRLAVMGFYVVSGYLITRVFEERYARETGGTFRFFLNRILRLYPLYLIIAVLSWLACNYGGRVPREMGPDPDLWLPGMEDFAFRDLVLLPVVRDPWPLAWMGDHDLVRQAWSLDIEFAFYLTPLLLLLPFGRIVFISFGVASFAAFLSFMGYAPEFQYYDNVVYKNAVTTAWFFILGGAVYFWKDHLERIARSVPIHISIAAIVIFLIGFSTTRYVVYTIEDARYGWSWIIVFLNVFMGLLISWAILHDEGTEGHLSRSLGELSYGIYLNHLLVAWVMLWLSDLIGFHIFGRMNDLSFGVIALGFSVAFAWATYNLIEMPVQQLRRVLRPAAAPRPIPGPSAP